jgi:flagellar biosynthesis/type III secretory pathway protein FliH
MMDDEDPRSLLQFIRQTYKIYEFKAAEAKDYELEATELYAQMHAKFVMKGFEKMSKGMTGLDSGQPWFIYWLT